MNNLSRRSRLSGVKVKRAAAVPLTRDVAMVRCSRETRVRGGSVREDALAGFRRTADELVCGFAVGETRLGRSALQLSGERTTFVPGRSCNSTRNSSRVISNPLVFWQRGRLA